MLELFTLQIRRNTTLWALFWENIITSRRGKLSLTSIITLSRLVILRQRPSK